MVIDKILHYQYKRNDARWPKEREAKLFKKTNIEEQNNCENYILIPRSTLILLEGWLLSKISITVDSKCFLMGQNRNKQNIIPNCKTRNFALIIYHYAIKILTTIFLLVHENKPFL